MCNSKRIFTAGGLAMVMTLAAPAALAITGTGHGPSGQLTGATYCQLESAPGSAYRPARPAALGGDSFLAGAASRVCALDLPSSLLTPDVQRRQFDFRLEVTS